MKILIIGGNRFFGKKLTARLLADGYQVTLLNRGNLDDGFGDRIARITCDRHNPAELRRLAGQTAWDIIFDQVCYDADEASAAGEIFRGKTRHYIFTSSLSVYGPGANLPESGYTPFEHRFTETADPKTAYAEAKRQCEAVFFQSGTLPVTAVRFPIVVGEDDYTGRFQFHVEHVQKAEPMYFPDLAARMSMISSGDAAAILAFLATQPPQGPLNAASVEPIVLGDFIREIETQTGQKAVLAKEAGEKNHSPYGIESDWYMDVRKLTGLGFDPEPISGWLPRTIRAVAKA